MIKAFLQMLTDATRAVPRQYFQLPVHGLEEAIYRERVYCYELYHHLRIRLEDCEVLANYSLCGELDKRRHPIIEQCIPDFLLHIPGSMEVGSNLVVIEVKPITGENGIKKDLDTLSYFVSRDVGYSTGIHLVYGDNGEFQAFSDAHAAVKDGSIQLWWHQRPGEPAERVH
jgi:hypothetical protein